LATAKLLFRPESDKIRFLPEGPYPLDENRFSWVAIQHGPSATIGSIHVYDLEKQQDVAYEIPGRPGFAFPTDKGRFVVGCEREVGIYWPESQSFVPFIRGIDSQVSGTIINDGVTWDGNLIFGTKDLQFATKKAGLYLWRGADQRLFPLRSDQICSNGKVIRNVSTDSVELLDIDTPTKRVVLYEINTKIGKIISERTVVDLCDDIAFPDGMTSTFDGKSVIISMYNPHEAEFGRTIQCSIDTGKVEQEWRTDKSPQATCPQWMVFRGKACLVITTAVEHMPAERQASSINAGGLFLVETDCPVDPAAYQRLTPKFSEPI
jgi:sugar lactone lactonase YvrE